MHSGLSSALDTFSSDQLFLRCNVPSKLHCLNHRYCKACNADTRDGDPSQPNSFLQPQGSKWLLRTQEAVKLTIEKGVKAGNKRKRQQILQDEGLSMPEFPYYPLMDRCVSDDKKHPKDLFVVRSAIDC